MPYNAGGMFAASDGNLRLCWRRWQIWSKASSTTICCEYDPVNDSWTPLASSPDQHALSQAVYFKGKLYNMGGYNERPCRR